MRRVAWAALVGAAFFCLSSVTGESQASDEPALAFYSVGGDSVQLVDQAQARALKSKRMMLFILGADWCHDSRALALQLQSATVKRELQQHYETVVINAGWLENLYDLLMEFNYPAYFGTPSLLIIDPQTKQLLNRDTVQRWQSAHSESESSLAHYLSQFAATADDRRQKLVQYFQANQEQLQRVRQFERTEAVQLYDAYAKLGPKLALESQGQEIPHLDELWEQVRRYRYQLQHDLMILYQSLENEHLELPENYSFSFK